MTKPDFTGWATRNDIQCSDGVTIRQDAFKHQHMTQVPLVWQHQHGSAENVLGHALLENRADGVYAYAYFNSTPAADHARELVEHGDVEALSIFANKLRKSNQNVLHGTIREVSLVLSGANPGAKIESINIRHGDIYALEDDEAIIHTGLALEHEQFQGVEMGNTLQHEDQKTVKDVFDSMTEEQKNVTYFMIAQAVEQAEGGEIEQSGIDGEELGGMLQHAYQEGVEMARNVFDQNNTKAGGEENTLTHAQMGEIIGGAKQTGSKLSEYILEHADQYGITNIDMLFPDYKLVGEKPELLARQADWVPKVLGATKHVPFSKIKTLIADLTEEEARAKGYTKGKLKKDEVISLLKRTTGPTTIYKKQRLDRDDIIDITDFDVVVWLKWEIRFMLDEEIARAILIGDGRSSASDDKIKDPAGSNSGDGIRSIRLDHELYAHKVELVANVSAQAQIDAITRAHVDYLGSGAPTWYTTARNLTDLLLLKDKMGRRLYETEAALATALRVKEIVSVTPMNEHPELLGIMVNLVDYSVGTNVGGQVSFFEDFDLDYNQKKFLMETRMSGALTKPKSAIVVTRQLGDPVTPAAPSFDGATNTITIPSTAGVNYFVDGVAKPAGDVIITEDAEVTAEADSGKYFPAGTTTSWTFTYTAG